MWLGSPPAAECTELPGQLGHMPLASIPTYSDGPNQPPLETGTQAYIIPLSVLAYLSKVV